MNQKTNQVSVGRKVSVASAVKRGVFFAKINKVPLAEMVGTTDTWQQVQRKDYHPTETSKHPYSPMRPVCVTARILTSYTPRVAHAWGVKSYNSERTMGSYRRQF